MRRPRLISWLNEPAALTLVVAPAGFGKTELAKEWLDSSAPPVQWFDGATLTELSVALVTAIGWSGPEAVPTGRGSESAISECVIRNLRHALSDGRRPTPVVIDNAHLLPEASLALLDRLLMEVPHGVRLILLTRRELRLPTVRLDLLGELVVIRSAHLAFDNSEASELVRLHAPDASRADVVRLMESTQGWPAALTLAARTLGPSDSSVIGPTRWQVLDYLLGESLDEMPAETREILIAVCHEPRLTATIATELSGRADAVDRLVDLARDGLLVSEQTSGVDAEASWRLHPLLLEVLRHEASTTAHDVSVAAHARGAAMARADGRPDEALRHATLTGNATLVATLLQDFGPDLIAGGQLDVVTRALHTLSGSVTPTALNLIGVEALARHQDGDVRATFALLAELEHALENHAFSAGDGDDERALQLDVARLRLWRARLGWADLREAIHGARLLIESSATTGSFATRACNVLVKLTAAETWYGDLDQAREHATESLAAARALGYDRLSVTALGHTALLDVIEGAMQSALDHATEGLARADAVGLRDGVDVGRAHLALAWAHFLALDVVRADAELDEALRVTGATPDPLFELLATVLQARLLIQQGRVLEAERKLATGYGGAAHVPAYGVALVSLTRAHLAVATGDERRLSEEIDLLRGIGRPAEAGTLSALRAGLDGRVEEALEILDGLKDHPPTDLVLRASVGALRMALQLLSGDIGGARITLDHLLTAVATHRLVLTLTWAAWSGDTFVESLREEAERPDAHPFAAEALLALEHHEVGSSDRLHPKLAAYRAERLQGSASRAAAVLLTPRELEVFEQLALGASYADIARALFVTENTIKTHVAAIYRKLDVDRRSESLRVGRQLGLIGWPQAPRDQAQ